MTEMRTSVDIATDPPSARPSRPRVVFVVDHNLGRWTSSHDVPLQSSNQFALKGSSSPEAAHSVRTAGRGRLLFLGER